MAIPAFRYCPQVRLGAQPLQSGLELHRPRLF